MTAPVTRRSHLLHPQSTEAVAVARITVGLASAASPNRNSVAVVVVAAAAVVDPRPNRSCKRSEIHRSKESHR